jgi:hypothetical protein
MPSTELDRDPMGQWLRSMNIPVNRENYIEQAYPGEDMPDEWTAEHEAGGLRGCRQASASFRLVFFRNTCVFLDLLFGLFPMMAPDRADARRHHDVL